MTTPRPAWQTDELDEEWVEEEVDEQVEQEEDFDELNSVANSSSSSISLTIPLSSITYPHTQDTPHNSNSFKAGTFHINENVAPAPFLKKTPGRQKSAIKDFFSPLPLERMFEPPSPPVVSSSRLAAPRFGSAGSSPLSGLGISNNQAEQSDEHGRPLSSGDEQDHPKFTFSVPKAQLASSTGDVLDAPQAQSTPGPSNRPPNFAPPTDPRLRLFQFQYDTFTRDHLSAMVDSIAVNTPSNGSKFASFVGTPLNLGQGLSRVSESTDAEGEIRSAKRVKLSPRSDYYGEGDGAGAVIGRPMNYGRDYVGEANNLMAQIKQARDFSTVSTVPSSTPATSRIGDRSHVGQQGRSGEEQDANPSPAYLELPRPPSSTGSMATPTTTTSSTILQQAATLMAQIKHDVNGHKRIFSGDTDFTHTASFMDERSRAASPPPAQSSIIIHFTGSDRRRVPRSRSSSAASNGSSRSREGTVPHRPAIPDVMVDALTDEISNLDLANRPAALNTNALNRSTSSSSTSNRRRSTNRNASQTFVPPSQPEPLVSSAATNLAPPSLNTHPSSSARPGAAEDLNRYVSSSTASSGAGSAATGSTTVASFVKHAGAPPSSHPHAQIRRIGPDDIPPLPERVGNMVLDPIKMRWVKSAGTTKSRELNTTADTDASEDPFRDIDSLDEENDDDAGGSGAPKYPTEAPSKVIDHRMARIEEQSEIEEDAEEAHLTSFSFDEPVPIDIAPSLPQAVHGGALPPDDPFDSDDDVQDERFLVTATELAPSGFDSGSDQEDFSQDSDPETDTVQAPIASAAPEQQSTPVQSSPLAQTIRSALKPNGLGGGHPQVEEYYVTPAPSKRHRRSVSFSDGKHEGQIRGLGRNAGDSSMSMTDNSLVSFTEGNSAVLVTSARSKRIADMMEALEHSEESERRHSSTGAVVGTPTPKSVNERSRRVVPASSATSSPRRVLSRSKTHRSTPRRRPSGALDPHGTFLTECSFAVSHDRLVQIITDVQPFEPYWEELSSIDLSGKNVDSVARLKEFLPRLDSLTLNGNQLCWLSGVPSTVRTLSISSNCLTALTSYAHLHNLEHLDISNNDVDSLLQLSCLKHLRELRADSNKITSLEGLEKMIGLVKLSLQGNRIKSVNLNGFRLSRLEMLNLSKNRLHALAGVVHLPSLIALNVDDNCLAELDVPTSMPRMRILRVSGNKLRTLDVSTLPNLRTLYADNNWLTTMSNLDRLAKLENVSVRNQSGQGLALLTRDVRDVKRLYISGNPMKSSSLLREACYNLVYLELAACRLTRLPEKLSSTVPNLRVLNLNYNFLESVEALEGLSRIKKLSVIGSRLRGTRTLVKVVAGMPDVEMLDFRMNPCTLGWYLPLLVKDIPGALQPSDPISTINGEGAGESEGPTSVRSRESRAWQEMDAKFRRDLPDAAYIGRLAYRGLAMRSCPRLRLLDGVEVQEKERTKAIRLLEGLQESKKSPKKPIGR